MKKTIISIILSTQVLCAFAVGVTQEGAPSDTSVTKAYGINVSTKTGLKAIVPSDFKLYIHKDVILPEYISWNIGKYWVDELNKIASANSFSIYLKWDQKAVFVTTEKVIEENKESYIIAQQAATTPLPKLTQKQSDKKEPVVLSEPSKVIVESVSSVVPPAKKENPMIAASPNAKEGVYSSLGKKSPKDEVPQMTKGTTKLSTVFEPPRWDDFKYTAPIAFSRTSVRETAQIIANSYKYRLVFDLPDFKMPGPVTFLRNSVEEDVSLLNSALGVYHYAYAVFDSDKIVVKLKPGRTITQKDLIPVKLELPYTPDEIVTANATPIGSSDVSSKSALATTSAQKVDVTIKIVKGSTLESALYSLAKAEGYSLEWKVAGGFEATKELNYSATSFEQLLSDILPKVGLVHQINNKVITITPGAN